MIKLINFWSNPVDGCQAVRKGDLIRPSYISTTPVEGDPNCIIDHIDTEYMFVVLKLNRIDHTGDPIIITKDELREGYGFFRML
jgi:hypothetical protein